MFLRNSLKEYISTKFKSLFAICPYCKMKGRIKSDDSLIGRNFKYVGLKSQRRLELKNRNIVCSSCKNGLRLSNGVLIKRKRNSIEFTVEQSIFLGTIFLCSSIFLLGYFSESPQNEFIVFKPLFFVLFSLGFITIIIHLFNPIVKLVESKLYFDELDKNNILLSVEQKEAFEVSHKNLISENRKKSLKLNQLQHELNIATPIIKIIESKSFKYETELQNYLVENVNRLRIFDNPVMILENGVEYNTSIGRIDILLGDSHGNLFVVELKRDNVSDKTFGQISRYMGWVKENLSPKGEVFGIILGKKMDDKLKYAATNNPNIFLVEYSLGLRTKNV